MKHCRELLLSKISKGEIAVGTTGLSQGKRLQWEASQYLTNMTSPQTCRLHRCLIDDLPSAGKDEQLTNFLCHVHRQEKKTFGEDDCKHNWLKAKVSILTCQGAWGITPWTAELRAFK